jgi:hypothetical protein
LVSANINTIFVIFLPTIVQFCADHKAKTLSCASLKPALSPKIFTPHKFMKKKMIMMNSVNIFLCLLTAAVG